MGWVLLGFILGLAIGWWLRLGIFRACTSRSWVVEDDGSREQCTQRPFHRGWHTGASAYWSPVRPWVHPRLYCSDGSRVRGS
jgi:hypothetical protein